MKTKNFKKLVKEYKTDLPKLVRMYVREEAKLTNKQLQYVLDLKNGVIK